MRAARSFARPRSTHPNAPHHTPTRPLKKTGCLRLDAAPLTAALKAAAAAAKGAFAGNLHKQGADELRALEAYLR